MRKTTGRILTAIAALAAAASVQAAALASDSVEEVPVATGAAVMPQAQQQQIQQQPSAPAQEFAYGDELFPADVLEHQDEFGWRITRIYELKQGEDPANIPRAPFVRNGWRFSLTDITRRETTVTTEKEHSETYYVDTETDDIAEIIAMLEPAINFTTVDGYTGVLELVRGSVTTEVTETRNRPWTMTVTREYPHLPSNDVAFVPKSVVDRNMTFTLTNVVWRAGNTTTVDYVALPDYYTAVATYSRSGSSTEATAHLAEVTYAGTLTRSAQGITVYSAHFLGEEMKELQPVQAAPQPQQPQEPEPAEEGQEAGQPETNMPPGSTPIDVNINDGGGNWWWLLIFIPVIGGVGLGGYALMRKQRARASGEDDI